MLLGRKGLPFRGQLESLTNPYQNIGNFLELLKFLSQYDSTIKEHLEKGTTKHQQPATKRSEKPGPRTWLKIYHLNNDSHFTKGKKL